MDGHRNNKTAIEFASLSVRKQEGARIQVLILHRSRLVREAIAAALEKQGQFETSAAAHCLIEHGHRELVDLVRSASPEVIILDLDFPYRTGLANTRCIMDIAPEVRIILTGVPMVESEIIACIETGVAGCELEDTSLAELVESVKAVHAGENRCSTQITKLLFQTVSGRTPSRPKGPVRSDLHLTRREMQVTELIEKGYCNKEIAVSLGIEVQTVKNHVHNILDKFQLRKRHDVARYARDLGLLRVSNSTGNEESISTST